MHEETQKIRDCVEGQKVGEKCASETGSKLKRVAIETKARRQEGRRRDWYCLNGSTQRLHPFARRWAYSAKPAFGALHCVPVNRLERSHGVRRC
jgi:hypothetical protein